MKQLYEAMEPNIFRYATSELSQDALICYILEFAKSEYRGHVLHKLGLAFVESFSGDQSIVRNIRKQWHHIDILVELENGDYILIEDKTNSSNHSKQLQKYKEVAEGTFPDAKGHFIYFKPMNDGLFHLFGHKDYIHYSRDQLLQILEYGLELIDHQFHPILSSAYEVYYEIERRTHLWQSHGISHWTSAPCINEAWQGLYTELLRINKHRTSNKKWSRARWTYQPQKNGGFYSFAWHFQSFTFEGVEMQHYLQFEYGKLCIKLHCPNKELRRRVREHYRSKVNENDAKSLGFQKNGRIGTWMTVAAIHSTIQVDESKRLSITPLIELMDNSTDLLNNIQLTLVN